MELNGKTLFRKTIPYTNWHIARNKNGTLCLFDNTPRCDSGKWFTYQNGERFYGMRIDYTNQLCEEVTFENSPHPICLIY